MELQKGSIVAMTEAGEKYILISDVDKNRQKNVLMRVTGEMKPGLINIERMNGRKVSSVFPAHYFRLATPMEIKMYNLKNAFTKVIKE
jgi:hypothetical protein